MAHHLEPSPPEPAGGDSIAGQLASRIEASPVAPGDALDWARLAADLVREAGARQGREAARLLHEAGRIHESRLDDAPTAAELWRRAVAADPGHLPSCRSLRRHALEVGDDATAAECLQAEALAARTPADRQDLLLMRGRLLLGLGRVADARAVLAEATAMDPARFAAAEEVALQAAAIGDRSALADAYARCASTAADPVLSAHYLGASAALLEEALGRLDRAGALALEAFHLLPADPLLRAGARRHAERLGQTAALVGILQAEAEALSGDASADAWHAVALAEERLGNLLGASAALERGTNEAPGDVRLLADLARVLEQDGRWEDASAALVALAAAHAGHPEPHHRQDAVAVLLRRAEIEETELGRLEEAMDACHAVLALEPGNRPAYSTLGRLCARSGDAVGLAEAFEGEAEAARDDQERAQRLFRAGEVYEDRLGHPEDAILRYQQALAADPSLAVARWALERLYERQRRWNDLLALLERDLEPRPRHDESPDDRWRLALLQRRAEVLETHVEDADRARLAWEAVLEHAPGHLPAVRALGRLHARAGRWEDLAAMFRAEASRTGGAPAAELLLRVADLLERRLGRPDEAAAAYREALATDPQLAPAVHALERLHRTRGEFESLVALLRSQAERAPPAERAARLTEVGRIHEDKLWDRPRAVAAYEEALRADPGHVPATRALDRLYSETGRTEELAELRRRDDTDQTPADRADRLLRLARLQADRAGDLRGALATADEMERALPGYPAALLLQLRLSTDPERRGRARAALGAAAATPSAAAALLAGAAADLRPPSRRDALDQGARYAPDAALFAPHVERTLRRARDPVARAALCQRRAAEAGDDESRVAWILGAAEAHDAAGDPAAALVALEEVLVSLPGHVPALRAARALYARRADWAAVRSSLQAEAAALRDRDLATAAWLEAGAVAEIRLSDLSAAAADYRQAVALDPDDPLPADRLQAVLGGVSASAAVDAQEERAREASDSSAAAAAWLAAARTAAAAPAGRERALEALDRALDENPRLAEALELRGRLRAEAGRPREALADLEAAIDAQAAPAQRVQLLLFAAGLASRAGEPEEEALRFLRAAHALAPEETQVLERLTRLLVGSGALQEAAPLLRRLAELPLPDRTQQAERFARLGEVEERLERTDAALSALRRALALDPSNAPAFRRLVRLESERGDPVAVAETLAETARAAAEPGLAAEAHLEAARIQAGPLHSRPRAIEHLHQALNADPDRLDVRALLAEHLEELSPGGAIEQHRALIARDPLRVESWAALFRLFERARSHDRAYVCASVLRWLGAPAPGPTYERLLLEGDKQSLRAPPALADEDWLLLRDPRDRGPLADLFVAAGEALAEVLAPSAAERGPPVPGDHPFRKVLADLARALGAPGHEVYPTSRGRVLVEPGAPQAVLVGTDLARRTTVREQRFLLGRAAARLRGRSGLLEAVPAAALWDAVAAAVRQVEPGWAGAGQPSEDLVRRVGRALSRKARKALEGPARALARGRGAIDLAALRVAASSTADRAGLVLCGDVPTAIALLVREPGARAAGDEIVAEARGREETRALLSFATDEAHFQLRQRLRVAVA
jgi:tetratricopeptide (TPR) repeat protein